MKYFGYMPNDFINGNGVSVSLWMAGCPHHCFGCHNQEMWNYEDGTEIDINILIDKIDKAISANGIERNLSILGGEPLAPYNINDTKTIIKEIKRRHPDIKVYLWTGYLYDNIKDKSVLDNVNVLIDGPFDISKRDITLPLRGSSNQNILTFYRN